MGDISLRRRLDPTLKVDVYEVKLGEEFLMSSLFTVAEVDLARLGLAMVSDADAAADDRQLDVVVGGLGLGYTARTVVEDARVREVVVVEALPQVIDWHRRDLLPDTVGLAADPRVRLVEGDFFAFARGDVGSDPDRPGRRFDAILLDVDHSPRHVLHPSHADLYTEAGLGRVAERLSPGGAFGLWSDDPPDEEFLAVLCAVFADVRGEVVSFPNALTGGESANTVYVGITKEGPSPRHVEER